MAAFLRFRFRTKPGPPAARWSPEDDLFAQTRMPLGDHLEELRRRLLRAGAGLGAALALVFLAEAVGSVTETPVGIARPVMSWITGSVEKELQAFYGRRVRRIARDLQESKPWTRQADEPKEVLLEVEVNALVGPLAGRLGIRRRPQSEKEPQKFFIPLTARIRPLRWAVALSEAERRVGKRPALSTMGATEAMMVYVKVALVCALVLAGPWVFWQLWAFVAAGLYHYEKRPFYVYLLFSLGLFLAGGLVCQLLVIPQAPEALMWFNEWLDLEPDLRLSEWLGWAVLLPALFGAAFQTPLVMLGLQRLGVCGADTYRRKRRLAWFLLAAVAAAASPGDALSMLYLLLPLCLLYELGICLCRLSPGSAREDTPPDPDAGWRFEG